ncbi:hypothetical protein S83_051523 [Arachis hypogaea]
MFNFLVVIYTHLKWVFEFLLYYPFYKLYDSHYNYLPIIGGDPSVCHHHGSEERVDCAVCLCNIGEGEEITVLRCDHIFHKNCLDRWVVGFNNATCPLCRQFMRPRRTITELGADVLFFEFCSIRNNDRETWWIR